MRTNYTRSLGANGYLPIQFPMLGDHSGVVPPDPIPNSAVKRASANGSVHPHARVGHRQAPLLHHNAQPSGWALCFVRFDLSSPRTALASLLAQNGDPVRRRVRIRTIPDARCPLLNTAPDSGSRHLRGLFAYFC